MGYLHSLMERQMRRMLRQADSLFREFHDFPPDRIFKRRCPRPVAPFLVRVGRLKGVIYSSDRGQCGRPRTFVHFMKTPPVLAANPEGTQLYILGGRYRVGRKGIVG